jgi:pimeloyl-ACP methyl ester carboxylesterase
MKGCDSMLRLLVPVLMLAAAAHADTLSDAREIVADLQKIVTPNGVDESYTLQVGGIPQWVYVRGKDKNNPILLFVHGGPAAPIEPTAWEFQRPLEEYFTVVNWDQRAAGKTYRESDPEKIASTLTVDRYAQDLIDVARQLEARYHKKKILLIAHSWGTIISLKAAHERPDLFYAYIGAGQVIDARANETLSFAYGLESARRANNLEALREMQSIEPYPGDSAITRDRLVIARKWPQFYGGMTAFRHDSKYYFNGGELSPTYSPSDLDAVDDGSKFTVDRVINSVLTADLNDIRELKIPILMLYGRHDYTTPTEPVVAWMARLHAPIKKSVWFENSAHMMFWEEPGKLLLTLVQEALPLASD